MGGGETEKHEPPPKSELDKVARGSMVKVIDPKLSVWYWVVIERRLKDGCTFVGRIDAHCVISPTLRHGGTVAFDQDNIIYIWPTKVDPIFDKPWFRVLSHLLSFGARMKALDCPPKN
jgi:hypothetical protein